MSHTLPGFELFCLSDPYLHLLSNPGQQFRLYFRIFDYKV